MQFNYKKFFIILGFIALAFGIGYALYYTFFRRALGPQEAPVNKPFVGGLPEAGPAGERAEIPEVSQALPTVPEVELEEDKVSEMARGGVTKVTSLTTAAVQAPQVMSDGSVGYYDRDRGKFYRVDAGGRVTQISGKVFHQVNKVNWAPAGDKAILEYPDGSKIFYDFNLARQATLPKEWEDFSFAPLSDRVAFKHMAADTENRWLAVAAPDGAGVKAVEPMGENADKVQVSWSPNNQVIATYWESIDAERQEVFLVGLHGENFKSMTIPGRGFKSKWSSKGDKLLYSVYNSEASFKPTLWTVEAEGENIGQNRKYLNVETWVDKCTFSDDNQTAYCAVPSYLPEGAGFYPEVADNIPDYFYKIDTRTGTKSILAQPDGDYTAGSVFLSQDEGTLYFTDKNTGRLNKIRLK